MNAKETAFKIRGRSQKFSISSIFLPKHGVLVVCMASGLFYLLSPLIIYFADMSRGQFLQLSSLTLCATFGIFVGSKIRVFDGRFKKGAARIQVPARTFIFCVWLVFLAVIFYTLWSAATIPIVSAFLGASPEDLSLERGAFLKGREGAEIALLYLSTIFSATLIPYSIVLLYASRSRFRHVASLVFFVYCISFMQKALFLSLFLPLVTYFAINGRLNFKRVIFFGLLVLTLLFVATYLSSESGELSLGLFSTDYFSASYVPLGAADYMLWRTISVPIFTASDTLVVFDMWFRSQPLFGSTSGLLSFLFDVERVNIERFVFEYQFGSWNEIANANSFFVVDAYVNFMWVGVLVYSLIVGQIFRWFRLSLDEAFASLWPLLALHLFSGALIGALLSNGFLYMIIHGLFVRMRFDRR